MEFVNYYSGHFQIVVKILLFRLYWEKENKIFLRPFSMNSAEHISQKSYYDVGTEVKETLLLS